MNLFVVLKEPSNFVGYVLSADSSAAFDMDVHKSIELECEGSDRGVHSHQPAECSWTLALVKNPRTKLKEATMRTKRLGSTSRLRVALAFWDLSK